MRSRLTGLSGAERRSAEGEASEPKPGGPSGAEGATGGVRVQVNRATSVMSLLSGGWTDQVPSCHRGSWNVNTLNVLDLTCGSCMIEKSCMLKADWLRACSLLFFRAEINKKRVQISID